MDRLKTAAWWYWFLTVVMLTFAVTGFQEAVYAAMALCSWQVIHFRARESSFKAFPVQVRIAYLGLLAISLLPGGFLILWLQLVGTTAMVTVNYCLLARVLSLMPWNRTTPVNFKIIVSTIFSFPVAGSVKEENTDTAGA